MLGRARIIVVALAVLAAQAAADNAASQQPAPEKSAVTPLPGVDVTVHAKATAVSGVDVRPRPVCVGPRRPADKGVPPPAVVSTFPAEGAVVRPGLVVLRFTFNVAMSCDGLFQSLSALARPCGGSNPQHTVLSFDRTMIRMPCIVGRNMRYGLRMNPAPARGTGRERFSSLAGLPLEPFQLTFSTSSGPDVTDLETAEAEDKDAPPPVR
jgi:hypothetical protein